MCDCDRTFTFNSEQQGRSDAAAADAVMNGCIQTQLQKQQQQQQQHAGKLQRAHPQHAGKLQRAHPPPYK